MKKIVMVTLAVFVAVSSFAQDAADKITQANEALQAQDYATAFGLYDEAMNNLGDVQVDASINFNIGYAAYRSENFDPALDYFDKAIEAGANVAKSYEYKAMIYNNKEDYEAAVENFEMAIETSEENDPSLAYKAGVAAYRGAMLEKAVELFGTAVEEGYNPETAIYYKAVSLNKLGNEEEYKATLIEGAESYPNEENLTSALARIYVSEANEMYKEGAAILTAANEQVSAGTISTADEAYQTELSKAQDIFREALAILEEAQELDASNANIQALMDACNAVL